MNVWCHLPAIINRRYALRFAGLIVIFVAFITTLVFADVSFAAAGINKTLSFQGRLLSRTGAVVPDGNYNIEFKIYQDGDGQNEDNSTGSPAGSLKWTEDYLNGGNGGVEVRNGYFSVALGSHTAFGSSIDWNQDTLWLSMNVAGTTNPCSTFGTSPCVADGEMLPMKRITSTPYALNAGMLGGKPAENFLQIAQGVQTDVSSASSLFINKTGSGNFVQLQSSTNDVFAITNTGDIAFGPSSDHTISVTTAAADTGGYDLTVSAGAGGSGTGSTGGDLVLQGGAGGGTNGNGGNVVINAGAKTGTGTNGTIAIGTSNTASLAIGTDTIVAAGKSLTITGGNTGSRPSSPTEGMVYYDTTTHQLLTYNGSKWVSDKTDALIVAASDSSQADKDAADYVADGDGGSANDGDQVQINAALTAAAGKKVILLAGTYTADATILIPNNTTLAGVGNGTVIKLADLDATENLIENSDTSTGTGVIIQDLKLDGQDTLNTAGTQYGIYFNNMGDYSSSSAGSTIRNIKLSDFRSYGIFYNSSDNNTLTASTITGMDSGGASLGVYYESSSRNNNNNNNIYLSNSYAIRADGSGTTSNVIASNTFRNNSYGIMLWGATSTTVSDNNFDATTNHSIDLFNSSATSTYNNVTGNTFKTSGQAITIDNTSDNTVSNNKIHDSGGSTNNNAIAILNDANRNSVTGNSVTDSSCTVTCYAVTITSSSADNTYLSDNSLGTNGTINDQGTGTRYGGQDNGTSYLVQPAQNITIGSASTTTTIQGTLSITPQTSSSTTLLCSNAGVVSTCDGSLLAPTATNFIQNQSSSQQTGNYWISGTARADTSILTPTIDTASAGTLSIGTTNATAINLNQNTTIASGKTLTVTSGATSLTGASSGDALTVSNSTSTGNILVLKDNSTDVMTVADGGKTTHKTTTNTKDAFQVQNSNGEKAFSVNTTSSSATLGLNNTSFETNTTGWSARTGCTLATSSAQYYFGYQSGQCTNTGTANAGMNYNLSLASGTQYTFSFYAKTTGTGGSALSFGYSYNGSNETTYQSAGNYIGTGWQRYVYTFTPSSVSGTPYLFIKQSDTTARSIFIDGVQIEAASGANAYSGGGTVQLGLVDSPLLLQPAQSGPALEVSTTNSSNYKLLTVNTATSTVGIGVQNSPDANALLQVGVPNTYDYVATSMLVGGTASRIFVAQAGASSTSVFMLQNSAGTTIANVSASGQTLFKNSTNTTSGFQVQGALSSAAIFNVDTTNSVVQVAGALDTATATGLTIGATNATSITLSKNTTLVGDLTLDSGANRTVSIGTSAASTAGRQLSIVAGTGGSGAGSIGGNLVLQGGSAGGTNANGGNVTISGGAGTGTGASGLVVLSTPTFQTVANDANCYTGGSLVAASCTITMASVNNSSAIVVGFSTASQTATVPDPTITTAGRVIYITAANTSSEFTLSMNGGGDGNTATMKPNSTAGLLWNGSDWTVVGSSTPATLQSAYDNSTQQPGSADLVVNKTTSSQGLTIRDSATDPVDNTLLGAQASSGANLFSVNTGGATNYASNAGAETAGGSSSTFPASTWDVLTSATVTRTTTAANVATGQAAAQAATTTSAGSGIKNVLTNTLSTSQTYNVSFGAKLSSGTFTNMNVYYSVDGSASSTACITGQTIVTTGWTKVTCSFTTPSSGLTSSNSINISQAGSGTARTFYIDNLSVTQASTSAPNVQVGGGKTGGQTTLLTLDRADSNPITGDNDALLGSMYYDTTLGKVQCYEADGWGACGSSPDNIITISPEYTNAVLHGTGIGTMTSDLCSDTLDINDGSSGQDTICGSNETYNFYRWTSPQSSSQTYSIYVTYQLPSSFKGFQAGTTSIMGRTDNGSSGGSSSVSYQVYRNNSSTGLSPCGSSVSVSSGTVGSWQTGTASSGADPANCSFTTGDSIVFKIDATTSKNANAYIGNLNFTFSNK